MTISYKSHLISEQTDLNELMFIPESYGTTFRVRTNGKATWLLTTDIIYPDWHMANHSINKNAKLWDVYLVSGDAEYIPKGYNYKGKFTPADSGDYAISLATRRMYWKPYTIYECISVDSHDTRGIVIKSHLTTLTIHGNIQECSKLRFTKMPIYVDKYQGHRSIRHLKTYLFNKGFLNV